ncbi:SapC protein [Alteromonadaceae bacterium Bs31]|nr:SapC protein [Alteromonadaceae bacterium Bs31]
MSNIKILNNKEHAGLRINTEKKSEYGDNIGGAIVFPTEILEAHKEYPIFFQKSQDTGAFQAVALFGFRQDENLFLTNSGWQAEYIPAIVQREPFLIGLQENASTGEKTPVVSVNLNSPRIAKPEEGETVFLEGGESSPLLVEATRQLDIVHDGFGASVKMFEKFLAHDLMESFTLDIEFNDGSKYGTSMYYTISQDKLYELSAESITELHSGGYLQLAYLILASSSNLKRLINRRNALAK